MIAKMAAYGTLIIVKDESLKKNTFDAAGREACYVAPGEGSVWYSEWERTPDGGKRLSVPKESRNFEIMHGKWFFAENESSEDLQFVNDPSPVENKRKPGRPPRVVVAVNHTEIDDVASALRENDDVAAFVASAWVDAGEVAVNFEEDAQVDVVQLLTRKEAFSETPWGNTGKTYQELF